MTSAIDSARGYSSVWAEIRCFSPREHRRHPDMHVYAGRCPLHTCYPDAHAAWQQAREAYATRQTDDISNVTCHVTLDYPMLAPRKYGLLYRLFG